MSFETILTEQNGHVGIIRLNRPDAMNAINGELARELAEAVEKFEQDDHVKCLILAGADTVFAAGADIKEMVDRSFVEAWRREFLKPLEAVVHCRKPIIAAVAGYALGGGCELAMMCDIIIAAETAKFGLPEITIGIIPGLGGTQRLTRAIGKSKAMEMILTGRTLSAKEAEQAGLVSRVVGAAELFDEAMKLARKIEDMSLPALMMAKAAVNMSEEVPLTQGLRQEQMMFYALFATEDQQEGMTAFIEKRSPHFKNK